MDKKSNTFLETEPVGKLMTKYTVPCIISLLVYCPLRITIFDCVIKEYGYQLPDQALVAAVYHCPAGRSLIFLSGSPWAV